MARLIDFTGGGTQQPLGGDLIRSIQLKQFLEQSKNRPQIQSVGEGFANLGSDAIRAFTLAKLRKEAEERESGDREARKQFFTGNVGLNEEFKIPPTEALTSDQVTLSDRLIQRPSLRVQPAQPIDATQLPIKGEIAPQGVNQDKFDSNRFSTDFLAQLEAKIAGPQPNLPGTQAIQRNITPDTRSLTSRLGQAPPPPPLNTAPLFDRPGTAQLGEQFELQRLAAQQANQQAQLTRFNKLADVQQERGFKTTEREAAEKAQERLKRIQIPKAPVPGVGIPFSKAVQDQKIARSRAGKPQTDVTTNVGGVGAFEELNKGFSKKFNESLTAAEGAAQGIRSLNEAQKILDEGIITGKGAQFLVDMGNLLSSRLGVEFAGDPIANTQAFFATMGNQVAQIIKQFGAGTGLSDADREFAQKIVGGDISLTEKSIRRLMKINRQVFKNHLTTHNKKGKKLLERTGSESLLFDPVIDTTGLFEKTVEVDF